MRRIRIFEHISLDGVIEHDDPYVHGAWTAGFRSPAGLAMVLEAQGTGFDLLLGRRTYDLWSEYWPKAPKSPMSEALNAATKYVATNRPDSLRWGPAKGVGPDVVAGVRQLKSSEGPDLITWGSSTLSSPLLEHGLVDEMVLLVYPLFLGRGKRVISESVDARKLALVSSKSTPTGVLVNVYRFVGKFDRK
ncbi:MAG TPA: dihydrofolate reductase family protein [Candidatus Didemnitutus sp.]|nr:dihydrofolate reductase family protein [Candidatus Didemnitutus sp.]